MSRSRAEFTQLRAVLDLDEDGPERGNDCPCDSDLRHSQQQQSTFADVSLRGGEHGEIAGTPHTVRCSAKATFACSSETGLISCCSCCSWRPSGLGQIDVILWWR